MNRVAKFLAHEGRVSLVVAHTTEMVEEIRNIHDLTPTTTAAMGRFATITGMMGFTEIKDSEDYFTAQINGQGPMGTMISVVRREEYTSKVKVCVDNPHVEVPLKENGKLVSKLVNVDRDLLMIPNLAIHMNREVNDGYKYSIQKDMLPLFGNEDAKGTFMDIVCEAAGVEKDTQKIVVAFQIKKGR